MRTRGQQPTLITEAELSYADQFRIRRRRYVIMMGMRVPFLIAAAATYHTPWLAITLICVSIPLPWMAVLVANDRPARKQRYVRRGTLNQQPALTRGGPPQIVEGPDLPSGDDPGVYDAPGSQSRPDQPESAAQSASADRRPHGAGRG